MCPTHDGAALPRSEAEAVFPPFGEMARLCRERDWAASPLGPVEEWPQSLRTIASAVLGCGFPSVLLWGPHLAQIYNDAYLPILGAKHPWALGISCRECWPEESNRLGPIYERVLQSECVSLTDERFPIRRGGPETPLEHVSATVSYAPVREEEGTVGGILCTLWYVTAAVAARRRKPVRRQGGDELRKSKSKFHLLVEAVQDYGIFMLDPQGRVVSWNRGAERIKGYTADEILGMHFSTFYTEEDRARAHPQEELRIATEQGRYEEEAWRVRKDGSRFWANVVITAMRDKTGRIGGFAKVTRDLTERRRAEQELISAKDIAEEANRVKADFLASISHELRTPLNAIGGYVELLDLGIHGPVTEAQQETLARIRANQRHLLTLINDVLAFAKLEAGKVELDLRPHAAADLLWNVERLVSSMAQAKGIALSTQRCDASVYLLGDAERIQQILLNLVANAIKFTPGGGRILLECGRDSEWVNIRVRDNGPGIPLAYQQTIFEPFIQIDRRLNSPTEGVGLGLAISRDLAHVMGGELSVESMRDRGSTFTLRLPAIQQPQET